VARFSEGIEAMPGSGQSVVGFNSVDRDSTERPVPRAFPEVGLHLSGLGALIAHEVAEAPRV
jgi:hypothetical protein